MSSICPSILCGGSGSRLWPLSRSCYPKQFMDIGGHTLFEATLERIRGLAESTTATVQRPIIVCNEQHRFLAGASLQKMQLSGRILLEPTGRNTAPAIALAALCALELSSEQNTGDPLLLVLPSDHSIKPLSHFVQAIEEARLCAEKDFLVTFGISPQSPQTCFGYIQRGAPLANGFAVNRFVEKPCRADAQTMLEQGNFFWNSGIFLFKASLYLEELRTHAPVIFEACTAAYQRKKTDNDFIRADSTLFMRCPADSIDYAIMEHTRRAALIPVDIEWNDLGSWDAFYQIAPKDTDGNACIGDVLVEDVHDCYLHASKRLIAALGVRNLTIVETADAVLVAERSRSQDVKSIIARLTHDKRSEKDSHTQVYRPWGSYEVLAAGDRFQVKRIIVQPQGLLSLQLHHHRAEHWVVVSGTAQVTIEDQNFLLHEDQSTYIPLGTRHRLENPGCMPLEIIEVQTGAYLGEDDIQRFDDTYGR